MVLAVVGGFWIVYGLPSDTIPLWGSDAHNYWSYHLPDPIIGVEGTANFLYSPVAAMVLWPLTLLSYPAFHLVWTALLIGALVWMARGLALPLLLFPPVTLELWLGQVHLLMAAGIVLAFRYPGFWAVPLLTKLTPGIGLLWYVVRREWRQLAIGLGVTAGLAAVSFALFPSLWFDWFRLMTGSVGVPITDLVLTTAPLLPRLVLAAVIVVIAAWRGWRWLVPVACYLALPTMWLFGASMLVACVPLAKPAAEPTD